MIRLTKIIVYVVAEILVVATVVASASQAHAETVISFNWGKGIQGSRGVRSVLFETESRIAVSN